MESGNRNVWIVVGIVGLALCLCVLLVAAVAVGWFMGWPVDWGWTAGVERERIEQTYSVGGAPSLQIDNFAGSISVRAGEDGSMRVVATKQARGTSNLDRIQIELSEQGGGLVIKTDKPFSLGSASVELEITAPADTRLDAHTGAGSVNVCCLSGEVKVDSGAGDMEMEDVTGPIDAQSGAGSVDILGATGTVRVETGAGSITYEGSPQGECRFESGAGSITLLLPADVNVRVDLDTGVGDIDVDFTVDGRVTRSEVEGTIGSGAQGTISAQTGSGSIDVRRR